MSESSVPQAGQKAPDFRGETPEGPISLQDFVGKEPLVLYFFPKADTKG